MKSTMDALLKYSWPGNIRELRQLIDRLYVMVESAVVRPSDLPPEILEEAHADRLSVDGKFLTLAQLKEAHADQETKLILAVMDDSGQNTQKAADILGIPRSTLASLLKVKGLFGMTGQERSLMSMISSKLK
jgi:DNA-binding NtrC family response regulator